MGNPFRPPGGPVWRSRATISSIYGFSDDDSIFAYGGDHLSIDGCPGHSRGQRGHFPPRPDGRATPHRRQVPPIRWDNAISRVQSAQCTAHCLYTVLGTRRYRHSSTLLSSLHCADCSPSPVGMKSPLPLAYSGPPPFASSKMYIGEFARLAGTTPKAIRLY